LLDIIETLINFGNLIEYNFNKKLKLVEQSIIFALCTSSIMTSDVIE